MASDHREPFLWALKGHSEGSRLGSVSSEEEKGLKTTEQALPVGQAAGVTREEQQVGFRRGSTGKNSEWWERIGPALVTSTS